MSRGNRPTGAQPRAAPAGDTVGAAVCTACALVCGDFRSGTGLCARGDEAARRRGASAASGIEAWIDGTPVDQAAALAAAASRLRAARRVLVTGLGNVTVEEAVLACDLADTLGAALCVAPTAEEGSDRGTLARTGAVSAAWEELRDRADLVLFWFHDPSVPLPRFVERFVLPPLPSGRSRRTLRVGHGPSGVQSHVPHGVVDLPANASATLARVLEARLRGIAVGAAADGLLAATETILTAIDAAECVGIVTGEDRVGTVRLAVTGLVRALSARRPAFEIPAIDAPPNTSGAAAVLTWRYGARADVARATPATLAADPAVGCPFDAAAATRGGAFDAILALGPIVGLEAALAPHGSPADIVAIDSSTAPSPDRGVRLRCRTLADTAGTVVRADGTTLLLGTGCDPAPAASVGEILRRLSSSLAPSPGGSR